MQFVIIIRRSVANTVVETSTKCQSLPGHLENLSEVPVNVLHHQNNNYLKVCWLLTACLLSDHTKNGSCFRCWGRNDQSKYNNNDFWRKYSVFVKFYKPGTADGDYPDFAKEAVLKALQDSGVSYDEVQRVTVGYVYGRFFQTSCIFWCFRLYCTCFDKVVLIFQLSKSSFIILASIVIKT